MKTYFDELIDEADRVEINNINVLIKRSLWEFRTSVGEKSCFDCLTDIEKVENDNNIDRNQVFEAVAEISLVDYQVQRYYERKKYLDYIRILKKIEFCNVVDRNNIMFNLRTFAEDNYDVKKDIQPYWKILNELITGDCYSMKLEHFRNK